MNTQPRNRIKVAQVVTRCAAGAGGVVVRGALSLDPGRYDVTILTGQTGPLLDGVEERGVHVVLEPSLVAPISPKQDSIALQRLTRLIATSGFDVVHTHSAKAGAIGRLSAYRARVPVIVHTYHGFPFHDFQNPATRAAYVAIERRLAKITDVVLAIGGGVATEALRRGLATPANLRTVAPAVEADTVPRTPTSRRAARLLLGLPDDARVVGTVGRLDYQKAPEHFVQAIAALRNRDAIGCWIGSGDLLEPTQALVRKLGLENRFRFAGERHDVPQLLPGLDVFAMSSRYEGLPCALVEAMRCGVPAAVTAVNSVPDLVVPGETGVLVPSGRPRQLAAGIDMLLDHPVSAAQMAARGLAAAGVAYEASRLGEILDETYTDGLESNLLRAVG
ncbi:MAG TPA: glycosyltransferase [Nocardioidaceae bacterium]|nr:glycosyltransferase [Nocardioidaceae bacterium]